MSQTPFREILAELAFDIPLQDISSYQSDQLDIMLAIITGTFIEALGEKTDYYKSPELQRKYPNDFNSGREVTIDEAFARWEAK